MAETRSITAGFTLPVMQSAFSAGLAALAVGSAAQLAECASWKQVATLGAATAGAFVWSWQLIEWTRHLRGELGLLGGDLAPEPVYSQEPQIYNPEPVKIHIHSEDNKRVEILDLPVDVERLAQLAAAIIDGSATFSESRWTGSAGLFSRSEFADLRSALLKRGLLAWNNPTTPARGVTLTRGGQAAFRYFASMAGSGPTGVK